MNWTRVNALTRVEVRRAMSLLVRLYLAGAGGLVLLFVLGQGTGESVLVVVMGVTLGAASVSPFAVMRDKLDRTLEFLLSLPVHVVDLVMARFLAATLGLIPGAVATGVSFALVSAPPEFREIALVAPWQFAAGYWLLLTLAAWCLTAAAASEVRGMIGYSVAAMVVLVGFAMPRLLSILDHEGVRATLEWFFAQPFAAVVLAGVAGAVMVVIAFTAFGLTHRAFARHQPSPEQPL